MDSPQFLRRPECWTISGMRGWTVVVLVGAFAGACSGTESSAGGATPPSTAGAGMSGSVSDGGSQAGASPAHVEPVGGVGGKQVETPAAGNGGSGGNAEVGGAAGLTPAAGSHAPAGGQGGAAVGGSGGMPSGGNAAPAERVLWSQDWTVSIHDPVTQPGFKDATMGLGLIAGADCRFGLEGAPSGTMQTYATDGACITQAAGLNTAGGKVTVYDKTGKMAGATAGSAVLVGWNEAVNGHTVKYLRRTQTYNVQLLGSGDTSFNYADFTGKWEAVGY